jgi:hypothetical protein
MAQATIILTGHAARAKAAEWCWGADPNTAVSFISPDKRTLEQNAMMWACLTEIAEAMPWDDQWLPPDDWKQLFLADMAKGARMVKALDGRGYVNLNTSSSNLRVREFGELLDAIHKFAAAHGIALQAPR